MVFEFVSLSIWLNKIIENYYKIIFLYEKKN